MVTESADMTVEDVSCIGSNPGCLNLAASEVTSEQVKCAYHCKAAVVMSSVLIKFNCQRIINDFLYRTVAYYVQVGCTVHIVI